MRPNPTIPILLIGLLFTSIGKLHAQEKCTAIKSQATIDPENSRGIKIDLNGVSRTHVVVSIFLPGGKYYLDTDKLVLSDLEKGKYLVVFSPRTEGLGFCFKEVRLTIQ